MYLKDTNMAKKAINNMTTGLEVLDAIDTMKHNANKKPITSTIKNLAVAGAIATNIVIDVLEEQALDTKQSLMEARRELLKFDLENATATTETEA